MREITGNLARNSARTAIKVTPLSSEEGKVTVTCSLKTSNGVLGLQLMEKEVVTHWVISGIMSVLKTVLQLLQKEISWLLIPFVQDILLSIVRGLLEGVADFLANTGEATGLTKLNIHAINSILGVRVSIYGFDNLITDKGYRDGDKFGYTLLIEQDDYDGKNVITGKAFLNRSVEIIPMYGITSTSDFRVTLKGLPAVDFSVDYAIVETITVEASSKGITAKGTNPKLLGNSVFSFSEGFEVMKDGDGLGPKQFPKGPFTQYYGSIRLGSYTGDPGQWDFGD